MTMRKKKKETLQQESGELQQLLDKLTDAVGGMGWVEAPSGNLYPPDLVHAVGYFSRAWFFGLNSTRDKTEPHIKGTLLSAAVVNAASLLEALERLAAGDNEKAVRAIINRLPHRQLIALLRNVDLHKMPLPYQDCYRGAMGTTELTVADGGAVSVFLTPTAPTRRRKKSTSPNSRAEIKDGRALYFEVKGGELYVFEAATGKPIKVVDAVAAYLVAFRDNLIDLAKVVDSPKSQATVEFENEQDRAGRSQG